MSQIVSLPVHSRNQAFQKAETLKRNRKKRNKLGEFFVEGVRSISAAVDYGWKFSGIYFSEGADLSAWGHDILHRAHCKHFYSVDPELLKELSDKEDGSELVATVNMMPDNLKRIDSGSASIFVLFDRPASPGNLGTSLRSCDAFGVSGVFITGHATDLYHPQTVRGSMGSLFAIPVVRKERLSDLEHWIAERRSEPGGLQIVGTSANANCQLGEYSSPAPVLLIVGNETQGMSEACSEICDTVVGIPQSGYASSLNVSCALSVVLYHLNRDRQESIQVTSG